MLNSVVPDDLKSCTTCCIRGAIRDDDVDLAVCTTYGYLLEISHGIVTNNCQTNVKDVVEGIAYYDFHDNGSFRLSYIIRGACGDFVVIVKEAQDLKVTERRSGVHSFRLADLENSGKPQLLIYTSPTSYEILWKQDEEMPLQWENETENETVVQTMPLVLQELRNQVDSLRKEINYKNAFIHRRLNAFPGDSNLDFPVGKLEMSNNISPQPLLRIVDHWQRTCGGYWITGLVVKNSQKTVDYRGKLVVVSKSRKIQKFRWLILANEGAPLATTFLIIVAADIPCPPNADGELRNQFEIRYDNGVFSSPEFRLTSRHIVSGHLELFHLGHFAQDLACMRSTHKTCELSVALAITPACRFRDTLKTDLNLRDVVSDEESYFASGNSKLYGFLIQIKIVTHNKLWVKIYALEQDHVILFVSTLKEIAPYGSKIELVS